MDCSLPGSFVHGISQARILEQVIISFSNIIGGAWGATELGRDHPSWLKPSAAHADNWARVGPGQPPSSHRLLPWKVNPAITLSLPSQHMGVVKAWDRARGVGGPGNRSAVHSCTHTHTRTHTHTHTNSSKVQDSEQKQKGKPTPPPPSPSPLNQRLDGVGRDSNCQ